MDGFISLFGEPQGIIISQLIWQLNTPSISLIAFLGGGLFDLTHFSEFSQ